MLAIFKKELRSYFRGLTGYVFAALLLVVFGFYASVICFYFGSSRFELVYYNCSFVFLIIVPVLTMRSFAEERRQKTDQLLYSLPVSTTQIVLGKYLAMLCVFAAPLLLTCVFPLVLHLYDPSGNVSYAAIYTAVCVFFFLGTALIAIGMFMSSLTENVFVSAIISFVTLLLCYLMGKDFADRFPSSPSATAIVFAFLFFLAAGLVFFMTKNLFAAFGTFFVLEIPVAVICFVKPVLLEGLLPKVFGVASLFERFFTFADGLFDLKVLLYYVTVAVLFTVFTVQSLEKRRWS